MLTLSFAFGNDSEFESILRKKIATNIENVKNIRLNIDLRQSMQKDLEKCWNANLNFEMKAAVALDCEYRHVTGAGS